jgi:pyridoxal phosphate-dependent aminotransferase EpsN
MKKRIYLSPPHMSGKEIEYINEAFETNWIAPLGPNVDGFEKELSELAGIKTACALSSGTAAIHLALKYLGIGANDIVFSSSFTFAGSCNPILYEKAVPVFIDSEPDSWNMSLVALQKAFEHLRKNNKKPKAVIITDLYGQSADMDTLLSICERYNTPVIEDAAEALGATYKKKHCGTYGKFGIYSFNGNKIITTSGGGMLVSDDEEAIKKCRFLATQARDNAKHYEHSELGYNYRMSNIVAGIGRGQLLVLDERIKRKKEIFRIYKTELEKYEFIEFLPVSDKGEPNYWLTVIRIDKNTGIKPEFIIDKLENDNIETRPVWKPMHLQPLYKQAEYFTHFSNSGLCDKIFEDGLCLPSGSGMTDREQFFVIDRLKEIFNGI